MADVDVEHRAAHPRPDTDAVVRAGPPVLVGPCGVRGRVVEAVPDFSGIVVDRNAVVSAVGTLQVATSVDQYFDSDSVAVRATWRIGHNVVRPNRIDTLTVVQPGS